MKNMTQVELVTVNRLNDINRVLQQSLEMGQRLDQSVVGPEFAESLRAELTRVMESNELRVRLVTRRAKERIRKANILAVDFSR